MLEAQAIRARRAARRAAARKLASKKKKRADAKGDTQEADDEYDALLLGNRGASISDETPATRGPVPVDVFVPLSTRCVVITGPNTGGKTAAMKAVGLASLMARAGLFIPAEIANLPWFDDVLVDIGDSQDLMQSLSTFSARLAKQRAILSAVTPRALVLMDEVGTGTSPAEGSAIGAAQGSSSSALSTSRPPSPGKTVPGRPARCSRRTLAPSDPAALTADSTVCPEDCNAHGSCRENKCFCLAGWLGETCSERDCSPCINGKCIDGECRCDEGFTGPGCGIELCPKGCRW